MELILAETSHKVNYQETIVEILSSQLKNLSNLLIAEKSKLEEARKEERKGKKLVTDLAKWLLEKAPEDFDSIIQYLSNIKPKPQQLPLPEPRIIEIEIEAENGEDQLSEATLEAEAAKAYEDIYGFPPRTSDHAEQKPLADTPQLESLIVEAPQETKSRRGRKAKVSKQLTLPLSAEAEAENELESQATAALQAIESKIKKLAPDLSIAYTSARKSVFLVMAHKEIGVVGRIEDDGSDVYISGKKTMKEYGFTDEQINWLLEADTRPKL